MVDGGWEVSGPRLVRNDLVVSKLTRDWHNDTLTCTASNTQLVPPHSVSAVVQMYRECACCALVSLSKGVWAGSLFPLPLLALNRIASCVSLLVDMREEGERRDTLIKEVLI